MDADVPKQYMLLGSTSLLEHSLERLGALPMIERIAVALAPDDRTWPTLARNLRPEIARKVLVTTGGAERMHSVSNALAALQSHATADDWVLVHDAVRPCVHPADIQKLMRELASEEAGGLLGVPVRETLKESDDGKFVRRTVDRSRIWQAATPQMFRFAILQRALELATAATDEAAAVEGLGLPVRLVAGRADNIKVTYPGDLLLAAAILEAQAAEERRYGALGK